MRQWYRTACLLGNPAVEDSIRREVERQFPSDRYPVNIDVIGNHGNSYASVRVTNFDQGINVSENAIPEEAGLLTAVIEAARHIIEELGGSGKFPKTS
jgi:hypothetical protein